MAMPVDEKKKKTNLASEAQVMAHVATEVSECEGSLVYVVEKERETSEAEV